MPFFRIVAGVSVLFLALGLFSFVVYKLLKKPLKSEFVPIKQKLAQVRSWLLLICCKEHNSDRARDENKDILTMIVMTFSYLIELCTLNYIMLVTIKRLTLRRSNLNY